MASASSQPSHTIRYSMFPWNNRGDGRPTDTTLLNTLAPMPVALKLLTHSTTKLPYPATKRKKTDTHVYPGVIMGGTTVDPRHIGG
ncbi:hypothetical protein PoB_006859200 [Plakobranchus ocellatus]|uniref:Uncharacterized protein n=1 Tax=Plakobranchus ocellatus TaxID=259542 RepID=A0AAV4DCX2_9GAST|nr:hypothetical protein PoB_006859200 [Plakobranchus ocellatus]